MTTEDASVPQKQSTEEMESTVELLPVEFQVSVSLISFPWNLSLVFIVCPCFFHLVSEVHFIEIHCREMNQSNFFLKTWGSGGAQAEALNMGLIWVLKYETVITKKISVDRKEMRSSYWIL